MRSVSDPCLKPGPISTARCALQALASAISDAPAAWLHRRQARATAHALGSLDDRMLRDLALDRSEVLSAAAELHGQARRERRHARPGTQRPR